ncbi:MAG: class I SAM-dependent DNA methyltransferase [Myxococcota bacterium]
MPKKTRKANPKAETKAPAPPSSLTRQHLEAYLWAAADILRGSIDSSDYKNFIFGLLFLKRLSDRFEEECEELRAEGADPEDPDEHQFFVPKRARWSEIQKTATGLGEALNKASAALEEANPTLEGVLAGIDYNDERKLGDAKQRDNILNQLVQHFAGLNLRNDHLSEPDMLGRAYEYLIEKFADDAGKKGGEFYTPHMVVRLIVELLEPKEGMRICDPTCGSGGMLIQSAQYITEHGGKAKNFSLFGQEKNLGTWAICKMNMLLHGFPDARIEKGDTIRDPKLLQNGELMLFDRVIANPPFSLDAWGREVAENDPHGRFRFGIPPKTKGDLAFFQHMVATLNMKGKMGIVMPHGVLFRRSAEGKIRKGLIEEDLIETVVGLPTNLFYGTGIPAAILIVNRDKPKARKGKILFVEASREYREGTNQSYLRPEDVSKIAATVHAFKDVDRYARVVPVDEIEKNDFNLNINRYVETSEAEENPDVASAVANLREAEMARDEAKTAMDRFLADLGYDA